MEASDTFNLAVPRQIPFTIRQLECFLAVAESGSIAGAAKALHGSDSAVSDSISAMERALGTALFRRQRSRGATLTSDGHAVLPLARRIITDGAELAAAAGQDERSIFGPVRIGLVATLASMILPSLLVAVQQQLPGVSIEYRVDELTALVAAAHRAELDLIVTFDIDTPPEYQRSPLATTQAMLVVASGHPLASRASVRLAEVAHEPMVLLDITASRTHTLELMSSQGIKPHVTHRTSDYELCRSLVGQGLGYTLLMRRNVSPVTWDGNRVVYIPIDPMPRPVDVLIAWPRGPLPPRVTAVISCAKELRDEFIDDSPTQRASSIKSV